MLALISTAHGVAALVGPIVGGSFAAMGWWRGAFWSAIPILLLLAILVSAVLPERETEHAAVRLPFLRLTLLGAAVLCVATSGQVQSVSLRLLAVVVGILLVERALHIDERAEARLFPARPLSVGHAVGTALWIVLLFNITTGHTGVFVPLVVQVLHGVSPRFAGYFQATLSVSWTALAVVSAGFGEAAVRRAIFIGPLMIVTGVAGQAFLVVDGPLALLAFSVALTGAGMGLSFAHITNWTIASARDDEAKVTASAIPTMQSLGRGFGAATAGLVANAAGLGAGVSPETVAAAAAWVYAVAVIAPTAIALLSIRLLRLHSPEAIGRTRDATPGARG